MNENDDNQKSMGNNAGCQIQHYFKQEGVENSPIQELKIFSSFVELQSLKQRKCQCKLGKFLLHCTAIQILW